MDECCLRGHLGVVRLQDVYGRGRRCRRRALGRRAWEGALLDDAALDLRHPLLPRGTHLELCRAGRRPALRDPNARSACGRGAQRPPLCGRLHPLHLGADARSLPRLQLKHARDSGIEVLVPPLGRGFGPRRRSEEGARCGVGVRGHKDALGREISVAPVRLAALHLWRPRRNRCSEHIRTAREREGKGRPSPHVRRARVCNGPPQSMVRRARK
mmetsp:Transcript_60315/g.169084  ORF Transcript_60315/g.169084 Transcript_60315/m.169084 type:complete len:214 (-) Transcript_60315:32-673(-)